MGDNDEKLPAPVSLRLTREAADALGALERATQRAIPRHRLMNAALVAGARALAADPKALLPLLGVSPLLRALGVAVEAPAAVPAATPEARPSRPVVAPSRRADDATLPPSPEGQAPARRRLGARADATEQEVDAMVAALRGALERGASVNAVCTSAQMASGGTRRRLAALLDGERPAVSVALARAITSAADAFGR